MTTKEEIEQTKLARANKRQNPAVCVFVVVVVAFVVGEKVKPASFRQQQPTKPRKPEFNAAIALQNATFSCRVAFDCAKNDYYYYYDGNFMPTFASVRAEEFRGKVRSLSSRFVVVRMSRCFDSSSSSGGGNTETNFLSVHFQNCRCCN